jgi:ATP-binding cassette subfamily C protein
LITFKEIFLDILKQKRRLVQANIIAIFAVVVSIPVPLLMPILVDELLLKKEGWYVHTVDAVFGVVDDKYNYVVIALLLALILRGLYFALSILQNWYFNIISKKIVYKIRQKLLSHISRLSLSEYEFFGSGKISSLMIVDLGTVDTFLTESTSKLLISILTIIGVSVVLLAIHWPLALFILFLNPIIVVLTTKMARKVSKYKKRENATISLFQDSLNETLDLFWQVRASSTESRFFTTLENRAKDIKDAAVAYGYKNDASRKKSQMLFLTGFETFRAIGILIAFYGDLSIGMMFAVFGYLWVIVVPIQEILSIQYNYHNAKAALLRINEIFNLKAEPKFSHKLNPFKDTKTNEIELKNINFSYSSDKEILKDINLKIKKGSKVAIVGASGSGKTTLAQIIAGFYQPNSGEVLFDNQSSKDIGLDVLREHIYMVLQSPYLFNESIRFNLTFGKEIDDKKITEAIKIAQLDEFVDELIEGVDTMVGKNGIKLSGGQRQRLSIARMIIANQNIVILDETTSSIDVITEDHIFGELESFLKDKTTIIIAHRLSTINMADFIYVVEKGEVVEFGTKEELLSIDDGYFKNYFTMK